jgi:D-alanyl-D-alanine carboxypeptidase/D-alanyl-D-alanine-endopeptidase (penicillin-binding protein 4)
MNKTFFLTFFLFFSVNIFAQNPIEEFIYNSLLENANVSVLVTDCFTGDTVAQYRPNFPVIPASTMKLVTTATALETLGADFRFETDIFAEVILDSVIQRKISLSSQIPTPFSTLQDSVLNGNIIIRGTGDPTLGSKYLGDSLFLQKWVNAVKNAGIKHIKGKILIDPTAFDSEGINPAWDSGDLGNYYCSGAYGISYMDNTYTLSLSSGKAGTRTKILGTVPEIPDLQFDNRVTAALKGGDNANISGMPLSNIRTVTGTIPANQQNFTVKGDIPNPDKLLQKHFLEKLRKAGIYVEEKDYEISIFKEKFLIYRHYSPELQEIISEINHRSNNHYAEHLFRRLALTENLQATWEKSAETVLNFWKSKTSMFSIILMTGWYTHLTA